MATDRVWTAALVVIGDEILSGRTQDKNVGQVALWLNDHGIRLAEVRIVPDDPGRIGETVNELRAAHDYLFTTGGIGPTHDDITADAIAKAFGVAIDFDPRAIAILKTRYGSADLNEARMRMARIPAGGDLITNSVSQAPGFTLGNVHVMAGVPSIMQAMLDALAEKLPTGRKMLTRSVPAGMGEGKIATRLGEIQAAYPEVLIGSYPTFDPETGFTTTIVVRSRDEAKLDAAEAAVSKLIRDLRAGGKPPD
jgi:molybdenum cofactor synthesis domain-containing protein